MKFTLLATTAAVTLFTTSAMAQMRDNAMELSQTANTVVEENAYNYEYNRDEQCQGYYWGVKRLGITDPCEKPDEDMVVVPNTDYEILNEYVVYFDFDKSNVRESDMDVIRRASKDIGRYNPRKVLVSGYTDTSGSMAYNEALSDRRADSVSDALTNMGVRNFVVDEAAKGETNPAVPTGDGVKLQENRRVTIQFVR